MYRGFSWYLYVDRNEVCYRSPLSALRISHVLDHCHPKFPIRLIRLQPSASSGLQLHHGYYNLPLSNPWKDSKHKSAAITRPSFGDAPSVPATPDHGIHIIQLHQRADHRANRRTTSPHPPLLRPRHRPYRTHNVHNAVIMQANGLDPAPFREPWICG